MPAYEKPPALPGDIYLRQILHERNEFLSHKLMMDKKIAYEKIFIVRVQKQDRYCKI